jgi:hypothetical protein
MAAICASLTLFAACSGSNKQGTTDSSAVSADSSGGTNAGGNASVDSSANTGAPSQAGAAAGDTSANKRDTTASPGGTPQHYILNFNYSK